MGVFSLVGVTANGVCLWLLWRHRGDDINMSSVYECSRNDIASNLSVFVAAVRCLDIPVRLARHHCGVVSGSCCY